MMIFWKYSRVLTILLVTVFKKRFFNVYEIQVSSKLISIYMYMYILNYSYMYPCIYENVLYSIL